MLLRDLPFLLACTLGFAACSPATPAPAAVDAKAVSQAPAAAPEPVAPPADRPGVPAPAVRQESASPGARAADAPPRVTEAGGIRLYDGENSRTWAARLDESAFRDEAPDALAALGEISAETHDALLRRFEADPTHASMLAVARALAAGGDEEESRLVEELRSQRPNRVLCTIEALRQRPALTERAAAALSPLAADAGNADVRRSSEWTLSKHAIAAAAKTGDAALRALLADGRAYVRRDVCMSLRSDRARLPAFEGAVRSAQEKETDPGADAAMETLLREVPGPQVPLDADPRYAGRAPTPTSVSGPGAPGGPLDPGDLRLEVRIDGAEQDPADPGHVVLGAVNAFSLDLAVVGRDTRTLAFAPPVVRGTGDDYGVDLVFRPLGGDRSPALERDAPVTGSDLRAGRLFARYRSAVPEPEASARARANAQFEFFRAAAVETAKGVAHAPTPAAVPDASTEDPGIRDARVDHLLTTWARMLRRCRPGRYRIEATYVSGGPGRWEGVLTAPPVELTIREE